VVVDDDGAAAAAAAAAGLGELVTEGGRVPFDDGACDDDPDTAAGGPLDQADRTDDEAVAAVEEEVATGAVGLVEVDWVPLLAADGLTPLLI
jgi:hypothetical protein